MTTTPVANGELALDDVRVRANVREFYAVHVKNLARSIAPRELFVPLLVRSVDAGYPRLENRLRQRAEALPRGCRRGGQRPAEAEDRAVLAVVEWVGWYNHDRLHSALGHVPPAEHEALYARQDASSRPATRMTTRWPSHRPRSQHADRL